MIESEMIDKLIRRARDAADNAYCPYSDFPVGAAVLAKNGDIYSGCNVENVSFGATICAERVAVCSAVADGCTEFEAIAIYHDGEDIPYPCGTCRQFLSEFGMDLEIIAANEETYEQFSLSALLPHMFFTKEF